MNRLAFSGWKWGLLGFSASVESYVIHLKPKSISAIRFSCETEAIEELSVSNKRFIFRIIQRFIYIVNEKTSILILNIKAAYKPPQLELLFTLSNPDFSLDRESRLFLDIIYRVDYYEGTIEEKSDESSRVIRIAFPIS